MEKSQDERARGRPRQFDRDVALDTAMRMFWRRGFEATSVSDLAAAMGINPPSLYAAFGDKRRLFCAAVRRYCDGPGGFADPALAGGACARDAVERLLLDAAQRYCDPEYPPGCMVIHAATNCSAGADPLAADLAAIRRALESAIAARIAQGGAEGEFGETADPEALAAFYATVLQGMSAKARDGATRAELEAIARRAMLTWPSS